MDPLSQGVLGANFSQAASEKLSVRLAALLGFLSGMAPDLDVLIRSDTDPLLFLEFHRQFTHSLIFIPVGGFLVATAFYYLFGKRRGYRFRLIYGYSTLGYATHALLDACTSYGTQLFWPFSDVRIAWNNVSIIDPLVTLPLLVLMLLAVFRRNPWYARVAMIWVLIYLFSGIVQRDRALDFAQSLAAQRGHQPLRHEVKPSLANLVLWKSIYEYNGRYYVDAVHVSTKKRIYPGDSVARLDVARDYPWLDLNSQQARDIERFRWFSDDFLAVDNENRFSIVDMRYSVMPNEIRALWGVVLNPDAHVDDHIGYQHEANRERSSFRQLWNMILGRDIQ